jgi:hypothetical protein
MNMEPDPEQLSERAAEARARLDVLVSQLDQRRHIVTRARQLASDNPLAVLGVALAAVGLTAGAVTLMVSRRRQQPGLGARTRQMARAVSRAAARPERVATKKPTLPGKLLTAIAVTAATTVVKRVGEKLVWPRLAAAYDRRR